MIAVTRHWVKAVVVGLNLCPFAGRELARQSVRFSVTAAATENQLLEALQAELELLVRELDIETTLLIHPQILQEFYHYNQFLDAADGLLLQMGLRGVFQVASFHPQYQFSGSRPDDVENYTNRSPYPMLHLIREASLERVVVKYPDIAGIPERNMDVLRSLGRDKMLLLLQACADADEP